METNHRYSGLTDAQVLQSRAKHGVNVLTPPAKDPLWKQYLEKFKDPLIVILIIAGMMSVGISCYECFGLHASPTVFFEPVGIFVAILLATGLAFIFEQKADKEFSILNQVNDDEPVEAIRNGNAVKIAKKDVVVGDILIIETGQEIPADAELLDSVALQIDESTLTGEPVCSKSADAKDFDQEATFPTNHVMRGTKVMEGHGICRVFAVGDKTENGKVFEAAQIDDNVKTPLDEQLEGLGNLITHLSYGFAAAIIVAKLLVFFQWAPVAWTLLIPVGLFFWLVIHKFQNWSPTACVTTIVLFFAVFIGSVLAIHELLSPGQDVSHLLAYALQTIMIAVTLIVVAVPEGLPMAVTLSLAYSMRRMLKTNNLVRKMHACETMGATTVICTDKTGTLTQNLMQVSETQFYGLQNNTLGGDEMSQIITEGIAVNSTAQLSNSNSGKTEVLGNPTEGALLIWLKENGTDYLDVRQRVKRLDEIPFSTERKYMATLSKSATGQTVLYVKGAPEIVFDLCRQTCGQVTKEQVDKQLKDYQDKAMRTLGFAYQTVEQTDDVIQNGVLKANRLTFLGIAAISDPVRSDVPPAVRECVDAGISVKIVTGDTVGTAKEIGRQIGLWNDSTDTEKNIITGSEFAKLADEQLQQRVLDLKIIARARPMDKKRLVEALQARNQVVAVTGDGTNDAPALHAAHVGLSMGDGTCGKRSLRHHHHRQLVLKHRPRRHVGTVTLSEHPTLPSVPTDGERRRVFHRAGGRFHGHGVAADSDTDALGEPHHGYLRSHGPVFTATDGASHEGQAARPQRLHPEPLDDEQHAGRGRILLHPAARLPLRLPARRHPQHERPDQRIARREGHRHTVRTDPVVLHLRVDSFLVHVQCPCLQDRRQRTGPERLRRL